MAKRAMARKGKTESDAKARILKAALAIFSLKGYEVANVDDVVARTGVGKGTIYRYFKNKEGLFLAVADMVLEDLRDTTLSAFTAEEDPIERVKKAVIAYLRFLQERPRFAKILFYEQTSFRERIAKRYFEHYHGNKKMFIDMYKEGVAAGVFREVADIEDALLIITSLLNGVICTWIVEGFNKDLLSMSEAVLDILMNGIRKKRV